MPEIRVQFPYTIHKWNKMNKVDQIYTSQEEIKISSQNPP